MIFSLQRTNPRLTTNIKLIIDDKDNMFLETINSTELLERSVYKAYPYNKSLSYGTNIKNFANQFPNKDVLYDIVDETKFNVTDRTSLQYHQTYDYGVYSDASKLIDANYRFFAPIHINKKDTKTPSAFVIFKIPAKNKQVDKSFNKLSDFINYGTLVKVFDLSKIKSIFDGIEDSSVNMQYEQGTITTGLSLDSGLMVSKTESVIDALLANETTITEFENNITNKFREHHLMYSNVINMEFAFNDSSDDKFVRYFGMYVDFNEVTETIAKEYDSMGVIRLLRQQNGYKLYNNTLSLNKYDVIRQSRLANGFGLEKAGEVRLKIVLRPTAGEKLVLKYGNEVEHTIQWNSTNIQSNINTTATWIANELTTKYKGNFTTIRAFVENNNEVVIRSNNTSLSAENLKIEVPNSIQVIQPLYTKETYNNNLIGSGSNTISVNTYFNPKTYNKLQYIDNAGVKKSSDITMVTKYAGDYLYRLKDPILNKDTTPNTVWFLETLTEQPIICSVIQHRDFSFDTTESMYNDVLDFDIVKYKEYLLSIVNDPNFRGRVDELYNDRHPNLPASETELSEYKTKLINNINSYFDNIDLNRSYLYKDIDVFTEEATTTNNEYDRLSENTLPSLSNINKLYPFINKWSYKDGTDVYGNDYRLNISLPFRYESFTPSLESVERDIRYHTHSWLIIGEGRNPYLDVNEQNIRKCLSYSRLPLTRDLLLSKTVDAYTYLKYKTSVREHTSYSKLVWNKEQGACYTYFRGVLLRFDDRTLDDYNFSAILFSQKPVKEDVLTTEWLRNDTHKTLTLIVNFYIPDPILTSLERGEQYYFLDRSLLYFSENIYSTGLNTIDFGTDQISLTLYDNTSPKTYLGNVVTNKWHYTDGGQTLLYVSRGNVNRFNTPLNELLNIGQDFTIDFTSTEDVTNPNYGMQITFKNIQEVKTDHFWCTDILVKNILTRDPDGVDDTNPNDNVIESTEEHNVYQLFKSDPNTFDTNNIAYISKAIAYENATYKKIVSASSNNARYRELSTANIVTLIKSRDIKQTTDDNKQTYLRCGVIDPSKTAIAVSLTSSGNTLSKLSNSYIFPIIRHDGDYIPQTEVLLEFGSDDRYRRIFSRELVQTNRNRLSISRLSTTLDRTNKYKETYLRDIMFSNFYQYSSPSNNNDLQSRKGLPWISNCMEFRSYTSIVLNSSEVLNLNITKSDENDLATDLIEQLKIYCPLSDFTLTSEIKRDILNLKYDVSNLTEPNYNIQNEIVSNFIKNTFLSVYELESVQLVDEKFVNFVVYDSILNILDSVPNGTNLKLTFRR